MELELKGFYDKAILEGLKKDKAIDDAVMKAIDAAVHRFSGMSAQNMSESISEALCKEMVSLNIDSEHTLQMAFETLIKKIQEPKEKEIERLITQIERLQRHLLNEENEQKRDLREIFTGIENGIASTISTDKALSMEALEKTKLEYVESLGILNETLEAALISVLEDDVNVQESIRKLTSELTRKALNESMLSAARIRAIITTILSKATELAEATPTNAKSIIHGTIYGVNDALISTVKRIKNQLQFAPEEIKNAQVANWDELINILSRSDELYKEIIDDVASKNSGFVKTILLEHADVLGDQFAQLKHISAETIDLAKEKLSNLTKGAVIKSGELKQQLTNEAKKLGNKAWKMALDVAKGNKKEL